MTNFQEENSTKARKDKGDERMMTKMSNKESFITISQLIKSLTKEMEIEQAHIHQHPLTLCEKNDEGKLLCPLCGNPFENLNRCSRCGFYPEPTECFGCHDESPSHKHSFYICKLCWPNSPIFHKSCAELPSQIQIPFRPHCSFFFSTISDMFSFTRTRKFRCDFCDWSQKGYRFCCYLCGFQICARCAGRLIAYHEDRVEHIEHFSHQHPLDVFQVKDATCRICNKNLRGQSYGCVPCGFHIHESCSEFPQQQTLHPLHPHPGHFLSLSDIYKNSILHCEACLSMTNYFVYDCVKCEFCLHPQCASLLPNVKYKGHEHLLILVENMSYKGECEACRGNIEGTFFFRCVQCRLNFHVQCGSVPASLPPTVVHKNHDHPLALTAYVKYYVESLKCYACSEEINPKDPCYLCVECEYYAHVRCAVITEIFCDNDREVLGHTSHDDCSFLLENKNDDELGHSIHCHTLTLSEVGDVKCKLCCKNIHGSGYGCASCEFYIHNSCAELPQELRHPLHPLPNHSLTLQESKFLEGYYCDACDLNVNPGVCYRCDYCDFALHLECAYLKPSVKYEGHEHLLILVENMSYQGICEACGFEIEGTFFVRCVQCCFNLHVQCGPAPASLPSIVVHKHLHDHPLSISTKAVAKNDSDVLYCDACGEERNPRHPYYCCVECEYNAHVRCVLTEVSHDERVKLRHFSHDHCLYFALESKRNDGVTCYACERLIQADDPAYGCDPCGFYLHKSCAELPWQPQHLLHRHPLYVSTDHSKTDRVCSACHKNVSGFIYECNRCDFTLDIDCFSLQFRVELQGDEQIFTFFEKLDHSSKCQSYNFMHLDVSNQRCLKCNFNIHLLHSPLPQTIQHMSHHHLLTLMDSLVDDEHDAQICDICEEERHPKACVYYCSECDFIAEFDCVISEVRLALQKKPRDVQFRFINRESNIHESIAGEVVNSKSSTLRDIEESLTEKEAQQFNDILQDLAKEVKEIRKKFSTDQSGLYSDEYCLQLMAVVSSKENVKSFMESEKAFCLYSKEDLFEWEDYMSELINVNDNYKTSPRLAGVLKKLLDKYGDIGSSCNLNQGLKNCVLVLFCATVHSMCDTMVQDITDDLIYTWWRDSRIAQRAGFRVGFVFDHLERIAEARHGIDTELYQISPIRYQYKKMSKLLGEIDQLDQDIGERKAKVDEFRKQAQEMISTIHPKRLRLETEELSKAMDIGIVKAGKYTGLL